MVVFYKWFQFKQITSARQKTSYASEVETKFYNVLFKEFKEKWKNNCDIIVRYILRWYMWE